MNERLGLYNLEEEISNNLFKKYGLFPVDYILDSLKEELGAINRAGIKEKVIILYDFATWLNKEKIPYWFRGTAGSSLLFYILGISRGNPLPAHSFCPKCKTLSWLDHDYYSGFDVEETLQCEKDGYSLVTDGHNIPWQSLWGYRDSEIIFTIDMPIESYDRIREFWEDYQHRILEEENLLEIKEESMGLRFLNIDCVFTIEKANPNFYENDIYVDKALESFDLGELPIPGKFSDLLYGLGLNNSTGTWTEKTKFMVENLGMNLSDMIAFREDIYFYLSGYIAYIEEAWLEAESFSKGKRFFGLTEEMMTAADKWKISICEDIKYLFPKAHCLEYIIFRMKNQGERG